MSWPLNKIYEYMAFYMLENKEQSTKDDNKDSPISFEQLCRELEREGVEFKDG